MSENEQREDSAELAKWRRKIHKLEDEYESGERNLKGYLKAAFGKGISATRLNLARELKASEKEKPLVQDSYGFQKSREDEITGLEQFPWQRGVDNNDAE